LKPGAMPCLRWTVSIIQPLIAPLYNGKSALEFVALLSGQADATGYDLTRAYWQKQHSGADFEPFWRKSPARRVG